MSTQRPLLTIAIPTYNGSRTIRAMLELLLPQVDSRVELVISDNCSTDETPAIIAEYAGRFPFIRHARREENIGADGNFLACMRMAAGRYILLLSDDDVMTEGALGGILAFLERSPAMGLVYLGTANFYSRYTGKTCCVPPDDLPTENLCTADKAVFWQCARHYWGFVSSFIISAERFAAIERPERYFGTYWLQSYIHILCAGGDETILGVVGGICIGAGVYITQSNFDTGFVDGISYRRMLDEAVRQGFPEKPLDDWYIRRLCLLASHGIVKERATGQRRIDKRRLFACTRRYPLAWLRIYPVLLAPAFVCRGYMCLYRRRKGAQGGELNREGDVSTGAQSIDEGRTRP